MSRTDDICQLMTQIETHPEVKALLAKDPQVAIRLTGNDTLEQCPAIVPMVDQWVCWMDKHGINDQGRPTEALCDLRHAGYNVYPGDSDSFGWLTAVVEKDRLSYLFT